MRLTLLTAAGAFIGGAAQAQTVNLWPGLAPGSERWTQQERTIERTPVGTVIINVVTPTLTAYLPDPNVASGTGVIIAPGGAFVALTVTLEGAELARWLQRRGIAAFVLKYRTVEKRQRGVPPMDMDTAARYGIADGIQALKVVREHAHAWHLSPDRIGMIGFSAGAMVVSGAVLQEAAASRPSFAAMIYGAPFGVMPRIPASLPPLLLVWARDDPLVVGQMIRFRDALVRTGNVPEVHVYDAGGHGFGMRKQGTSSDQWIGAFHHWLEAQGLTSRSRVQGAASAVERFVHVGKRDRIRQTAERPLPRNFPGCDEHALPGRSRERAPDADAADADVGQRGDGREGISDEYVDRLGRDLLHDGYDLVHGAQTRGVQAVRPRSRVLAQAPQGLAQRRPPHDEPLGPGREHDTRPTRIDRATCGLDAFDGESPLEEWTLRVRRGVFDGESSDARGGRHGDVRRDIIGRDGEPPFEIRIHRHVHAGADRLQLAEALLERDPAVGATQRPRAASTRGGER
jgi:Esterase/lipase